MASYRDDMNDTAVIKDVLWGGLKTIAESTARVSETVFFGLALMLSDSAVASDKVIDQSAYLTQEYATGSDAVFGGTRKSNLVSERGKGKDVLFSGLRLTLEDSAHVTDELPIGIKSLLVESATASDGVIGQRYASATTTEKARAKDVLVNRQRLLLEDTATGADSIQTLYTAKALLTEAARATDSVQDAVRASAKVLVEKARGQDEIFGVLRAADLVNDKAGTAWDEPLQPGGDNGQAWTSDVTSWAMSRYAPFTFTGLALIDGKVYATAEDGLYRLDGATEDMKAELRTGKLDMSGSVLVHPVESHMEYTLDGAAQIDVMQTQDGQSVKAFTYPMSARPAQVLTNGRAVFGRGLRGRHYSYTLRLTGKQAYINDWSVTVAPSKRSI